MKSNISRPRATWGRSRPDLLASLLGAAAAGWTVVALTVHTGGPAALDPDGATDAALARTGAVAMAVLAAVAALLWRRHQVTVGRPGGTGGWRRAAVAASVVHLVPVLAVIALAPWSWKAPLIAFACAVITCGVQEAASAAAPAGGRAVRPVPTSA